MGAGQIAHIKADRYENHPCVHDVDDSSICSGGSEKSIANLERKNAPKTLEEFKIKFEELLIRNKEPIETLTAGEAWQPSPQSTTNKVLSPSVDCIAPPLYDVLDTKDRASRRLTCHTAPIVLGSV